MPRSTLLHGHLLRLENKYKAQNTDAPWLLCESFEGRPLKEPPLREARLEGPPLKKQRSDKAAQQHEMYQFSGNAHAHKSIFPEGFKTCKTLDTQSSTFTFQCATSISKLTTGREKEKVLTNPKQIPVEKKAVKNNVLITKPEKQRDFESLTQDFDLLSLNPLDHEPCSGSNSSTYISRSGFDKQDPNGITRNKRQKIR